MTAVAGTHARALRGLARSSTLNLVGGGATAVLTLLLMLVFTRGLGAAAAGILFSAMALFQVAAAIAGLGVETGVVRFITARRTTAAIGVDDNSLWRIAFVPVVLAGVILAVLLYGTAGPVGAAIGGNTLGGEAAEVLRAMAVFLPGAAVGAALLGATRGYATIRPTVILDRIGRPAFQVATVAVAVAAEASIGLVAALWAAAFLLEAAAAWWWLAKLRDADPQAGWSRPRRQAASSFWRFTLPRAAATTLRTTLQWFDVVLVAALSSPGAAAVYTVATRLLQLGLLAAFSVGQAAEPLFGEAVAADDTARTGRLYQVATAWLILITWPIYILVTLFAPAALGLFGPDFTTGEGVVLILVVSVLFGASVGPADILLVMKGKPTWSLWNTAATLAVNLALNLVLIPRMGITGAAVAWTVSRVVGNVLPVAQLWRSAGLHPFGTGWPLAIGVSLASFGVVGLVARTAIGTALGVALGAAVVAGVAFVLLVRRLKVALAIDLALSALRKAAS